MATIPWRFIRLAMTVAAAFGIAASVARAVTLDIALDTTPIAGVAGFLAFDVVDGDGVANNSATISGFATDGMLSGPVNPDGDVTGTLIPSPAVIGDGTFLAELRQAITFGNAISFRLDATTFGTFAPFPDEFSFFLLGEGGVPFPTTDPLGADALIVVDISATSPALTTFASLFASVISPTPTPTNTATATSTPPPTATETSTPTETLTSAATDTPTATQTSTATSMPAATPTNTETATIAPRATATEASTRTQTGTGTATAIPTATQTSTVRSTPTPSIGPLATSTATSTSTATGTLTPTPTPMPTRVCVGDCGYNGMVAINELILGVHIALDLQPTSACPAFANHEGMVDIVQLIQGVRNALNGCALPRSQKPIGNPITGPPRVTRPFSVADREVGAIRAIVFERGLGDR